MISPYKFHRLSHTPISHSMLYRTAPNYASSPLQGMDRFEKALKTSYFRPEIAMKMTHHQSSVDDFFVDNLLDLSNGFAEDEIEQLNEHPNGFNTQKPCSVSPQKKMEPENGDFGCELSFPENGLDNLEWLSQFIEEDSYSGHSLIGKLPVKKNQSVTENPVQVNSCFTAPVQTKPRTKRGRIGGRVWSFTGSSTSSASSSTTTTTAESIVRFPAPVNKRRKMTAEKPVQPRRCSHCGVQKTPQWRTGPMGAKTLCNACGVRFKSGRLLPEYRPACSPTFSSERHSNNHRKVLEMRQKKEVGTGGARFAPPVHSF
ncbi:hypothetical protein H5410_014053 [Solanum commersonii]|uniref:GATA-type domain-containing protein n=1 Tax=Solanum commersonii TaxID=4109 RepID=A0A9J5ZPU7_SOLCO|nr:hypothetical protein H5410_014053 [Solanum commersonii]